MNRFKVNRCRGRCTCLIGLRGFVPVFLFALAGLLAACSQPDQSRPQPEVPVKTAIAAQRDIPVELSANGTVEAFAVVNVTSRVDGQVTGVHFREGQDLQKGELLFTIDNRPYQAALESARSRLAQDRIRLEKAQKDAVRYTDLLKKDYVTKSQQEQTLADAEALAAAVKGDEAALENAALNVAYCRITAPINGRAGSILIDAGNLVKANDTNPLVVIHQIRPVLVRFSVPEESLPEIRRQMAGHALKVLATAPGRQKETKQGLLTFVDNTVNPNTGTVELKAAFENKDSSLWPGQFLNVVLVLGVHSGAVVVPSAAVQMGQQGSYLFVVRNDLTVESRNVTPGAQVNGQTVIEKGLAAGETVVTDGQLRLFPGVKVILKNEPPASGDARR